MVSYLLVVLINNLFLVCNCFCYSLPKIKKNKNRHQPKKYFYIQDVLVLASSSKTSWYRNYVFPSLYLCHTWMLESELVSSNFPNLNSSSGDTLGAFLTGNLENPTSVDEENMPYSSRTQIFVIFLKLAMMQLRSGQFVLHKN